MRRLLKLLALLILALLLLGPAARAQDFQVTSSLPAPGDSSVALRDTVTFTFSAPLDTTRRFVANEGEQAEWPVHFITVSPRDSIQIDSVRYSDDLTQIHFDVTHTDDTDFVWILSQARHDDTTGTLEYRQTFLKDAYLLRYTTAARWGAYSITGSTMLCVFTKRTDHDKPGWVVMLLRSQPDFYEWPENIDVAAAAIDHEASPCAGEYIVEKVRSGTYWLVAAWADYFNPAVGYDATPDGSLDSIVVDSHLTSIDIILKSSSTDVVEVRRTAVLHPNRPNPFRTTTRLPFTLEHPARVRLVVYDLLGRPVAALADGFYPAGEHAVTWQAEDAPPGVYLVRLESEGIVLARPVMRVR